MIFNLESPVVNRGGVLPAFEASSFAVYFSPGEPQHRCLRLRLSLDDLLFTHAEDLWWQQRIDVEFMAIAKRDSFQGENRAVREFDFLQYFRTRCQHRNGGEKSTQQKDRRYGCHQDDEQTRPLRYRRLG